MYKNIIVLSLAFFLGSFSACSSNSHKDHTQSKGEFYTCAMHPDVVKEKPGVCPVCSMLLVKKTRATKKTSPNDAANVFTCPMHPEVVQDKPGLCPVCNMHLTEKKSEEKPTSQIAPSVNPRLTSISISPTRQIMAGVKTQEVKHRSLTKVIRTSGLVAFDRNLYVAAQEYVSTLNLQDSATSNSAIRAQHRDLTRATREKLELLGMSPEEIKTLRARRQVDQNLYAPSKDSSLWVNATFYEYERPWIEVGEKVEISTQAFPNQIFVGEIKALVPQVDPTTRTFTARIEIPKTDQVFSASMFTEARLTKSFGEHLSVPNSSLMDRGNQKIAWVQTDSQTFAPRVVEVDLRTDEYSRITSGLLAGEQVVSRGGFLLDSEAKLQPQVAMASPSSHPHL